MRFNDKTERNGGSRIGTGEESLSGDHAVCRVDHAANDHAQSEDG